ncbi:MAG: hypothetical protein WD989_01370 [Candidatus Paceibacterota bacterium]
MLKRHRLEKYLVIVLAVVAVGLAGLIYKQKMGGWPSALSEPDSGNRPQASAVGPVWSPSPGSEEEYLFSIKMDSPDEEKMKHYQYAISISKESEYLNLTNCSPEPLVLKAINNGTIKLKNDGEMPVTMVIDAEHTYLVGPKSTKSVKADLGKGVGLYGYGCNNSSGPRGMIFVSPN